MSTRSATIIRQATYWGEEAETEEIMRFYRHYDGYPEGHGLDMAKAIEGADTDTPSAEKWLADVLRWFLTLNPYTLYIEFEPYGCEHGDIEFLYVIDGTVDHRLGRKRSYELPVTISVYQAGPTYAEALSRQPLFTGTAYEYIERFGKEL